MLDVQVIRHPYEHSKPGLVKLNTLPINTHLADYKND